MKRKHDRHRPAPGISGTHGAKEPGGMQGPPPAEIAAALRQFEEEVRAMAGGDARQFRAVLMAQVTVLDKMFHHLSDLAEAAKDNAELHERYLRLALRAQARSAQAISLIDKLSQERGPAAPATTAARNQAAAGGAFAGGAGGAGAAVGTPKSVGAAGTRNDRDRTEARTIRVMRKMSTALGG